MPRLLIVSRCSNPRGGADQIIADLCRHLPSFDWDVQLALTQGKTYNNPLLYREVHKDLPIITVDGSLGIRRARVNALVETIDQEQPDIVLVMRVFDAMRAIVKSKTQPRLALGVRSFEAGYMSDVRRYREAIDCCITSGKLIAKACVHWAGMDPSRVHSIAGGVRPPIQSPAIRVQPSTPIRLLYAGRIERNQKRCHDIVPFVNRLVSRGISFHFDIVGTGEYEPELRSELRSLTEKGKIAFHGWVDRERLYREFYPAADVFVHFAAWEGVTIAPREAMAHGVVPIISRFDGLVEEGQFVDQLNSMTFPIGHIDRAVDSLETVCTDPALFQRLSRNAAESQHGDYSFEGAIGLWNSALSATLKMPKRTGRIPEILDRVPGRLSSLRLPPAIEYGIRYALRRPIKHRCAGSEWPTDSGLLTEAEKNELYQLANPIR
ncbi:glycosyltransferase family 4 protein [Stieleria sp. JC731]|uniref:glycosyltransferase family 4 protein n=1 Tax=Pirellulaceae TaxID=2691357 RepID=UPI001E2B5086|nr:glycosyltransferase family 4 protein [Stieleria sp. JC731]MCC9601234.1 glycosyltransferase family 4 protein [Stieleria sp. JC731]